MNPVMLGLIIGGAAIVILAMTFAANNAFNLWCKALSLPQITSRPLSSGVVPGTMYEVPCVW